MNDVLAFDRSTGSRSGQTGGVQLIDPPNHSLVRVVTGDIRQLTGRQEFVASVPVNLVYVADLDRMSEASAEDKALYSAADAGFIAQNVYLYCVSAGYPAGHVE